MRRNLAEMVLNLLICAVAVAIFCVFCHLSVEAMSVPQSLDMWSMRGEAKYRAIEALNH